MLEPSHSDGNRKIVVIKSSATSENSHSSYALDCLVTSLGDEARARGFSLDFREYQLVSIARHLVLPAQSVVSPPELEALISDFFHNDLLLIGVQNHNFAPSLLLQAFFQFIRPQLLSFDADESLVSRNLEPQRIGIVLTGRSSRIKYILLNRLIFFVHFNLLFDFWGQAYSSNPLMLLLRPQHRIAMSYLEDCLRTTFAFRKKDIAQRMQIFAKRLIHFLK